MKIKEVFRKARVGAIKIQKAIIEVQKTAKKYEPRVNAMEESLFGKPLQPQRKKKRQKQNDDPLKDLI